MGYRTRFTVSATTADEDLIIETLAEESGYSVDTLQAGESVKWYDQHEDCLAMSLHYPEATIRVEGSGEEDGDLWVAWYRNGKYLSYSPRIRLPLGDEPPGGWDQKQIEPTQCWVGIDHEGTRWYFDTEADLLECDEPWNRTYTMSEDLR